MAIKNISISSISPMIGTLAAANSEPSKFTALPEVQALKPIWEALGFGGEMPDPVAAFKGRAYIPKVYKAGECLEIRWGEKTYNIGNTGTIGNASFGYTVANTGFEGLHLAFKVKDGKDTLVAAFPVQTKDNDQTEVKGLASSAEIGDLLDYIDTQDLSSQATNLDKKDAAMVERVQGSHLWISYRVKEGKLGKFVVLVFQANGELYSTYAPKGVEAGLIDGLFNVTPENPATLVVNGTKVSVEFDPQKNLNI